MTDIGAAPKVLVQFDLTLPLDPQLENAEANLLLAQKVLEEATAKAAQARGRDATAVMQELFGANK
jgi:hypothetical protein